MRSTKLPSISATVLLCSSLLAAIFAAIHIVSDISFGSTWFIYITLATFSWIASYLWSAYAAFRTLYTLLNAYLLALFLFHLALIYQVSLGLVEIPVSMRGEMAFWFERAGWYVLLALGSLGLGSAVAMYRGKRDLVPREAECSLRKLTNAFWFQQGIGLLLASIVFAVLAVRSYGNILSYSRTELFASSVDSRGFGVFMMVFPGALTLLVISAQSKAQKLLSYTLASIAFCLVMLSGYRSEVLFPTLIGVILWAKSGRRIPIYIAVGSIVLLLAAIAAVSIFRQLGTYNELGSEQLKLSIEQSSIEDAVSEMGSTVAVLAQIIRIVPNEDPFIYGRSYASAAAEMLPNIGSTPNVGASRSVIKSKAIGSFEPIYVLRPADWITYRLDRWKFSEGQGVGFSAIGEAYINFGAFGVLLFFAMLGYALTKVDLKSIYLHPILFLIVASAFWPLIKTVRNDFGNFTKPFAFIVIVLILWNIGLTIIGRRIRILKK